MTLSYYVADPEIRRRAWLMRRDLQAGDVAAQRRPPALADLERQGRLLALITQNVDGLHQAAGSVPERVLEVHGTVHEVVCLSCGDRTTMRSALDRVERGRARPGVPGLRRDPEVGDDQLRAGARRAGARRRGRGGRATATSSSPSAPRCRCGRSPG